MYLKNDFVVKAPYTGKSKYDFWKNLKVGDIVTISVKIESSYSYSTQFKVECNGVKFEDGIGAIQRYLAKMTLEPKDDPGFTGCYDGKGRKIYEGDTVLHEHGEGEVVFQTGKYVIGPEGWHLPTSEWRAKQYEVTKSVRP